MRKALYTIIAVIMAITAFGCSGSNRSTQPQGSVTTIGSTEFEKLLNENKDIRLIDVRTAKEFANGHLLGAENKDVNQPDFDNGIELQKGRKARNIIAVYCRSGKRSLKAANILANKGFMVYNLGGGILAWQQAGKPITK